MEKACSCCGKPMEIFLRTVVVSRQLEIDHVPVYACEECGIYEVFSSVKNHVKVIMEQSQQIKDQQSIDFAEKNEVAYLLNKAADTEYEHISLEEILNERVNQLLDMLIMARALDNREWMNDLQNRLSQITEDIFSTHDIS